MMQFPSDMVTVVVPLPLPVVAMLLLMLLLLLLTLPLPECTVTPFPPEVCAVTLPFPAVTELERLPEGVCSPGFSLTTLQWSGLSADSSAAKAAPLIAPTHRMPTSAATLCAVTLFADMRIPFPGRMWLLHGLRTRHAVQEPMSGRLVPGHSVILVAVTVMLAVMPHLTFVLAVTMFVTAHAVGAGR